MGWKEGMDVKSMTKEWNFAMVQWKWKMEWKQWDEKGRDGFRQNDRLDPPLYIG